MADDHNQRPYRPNETPGRPNLSAGPAGASDPLAELARLIGQSDPFAEFGRQTARQAPPAQEPPSIERPPQQPANPAFAAPPAPPPPAAPRQSAPEHFAPPATRPPPPQFAQAQSAPRFEQQPYGGPPYAADAHLDHADAPMDAPMYGEAHEHDAGYAADPYHHDPMQSGDHGDIYEDAAPSRRRIGIIAIAAVFGLAVVGTAGAFGYRAMFGASGSHVPPPVIKADTTPSKIVPSAAKNDTQQSKLSYDRVGEHDTGEKLVSREEQPVAITPKPDAAVLPQAQTASLQPGLGSGVVASEPRKIHTIVIHPDDLASANPPAAAASPMAPGPVEMPAAPATPPEAAPTSASAAPEPAAEHAAAAPQAAVPEPPRKPEPRHAATRSLAPERHEVREAVRRGNAPLSLSPDAPTPTRRVTTPMRTASVAPAERTAARAAGTGGHGYAVQLTAQRSEADAQAAFHNMQAKYPSQLGGRQVVIRKVELGTKGTYYRAMVGPFGNSSEASKLCSSLKAAGGRCFVQRI
jgi:SPOR domain